MGHWFESNLENFFNGLIAQLVLEHLTVNQRVVGSNPTESAINKFYIWKIYQVFLVQNFGI